MVCREFIFLTDKFLHIKNNVGKLSHKFYGRFLTDNFLHKSFMKIFLENFYKIFYFALVWKTSFSEKLSYQNLYNKLIKLNFLKLSKNVEPKVYSKKLCNKIFKQIFVQTIMGNLYRRLF